ncbi:MAG: EamA family transporter [Actinomycetota bacterium]
METKTRFGARSGYVELIVLGALWGSIGIIVTHVRVGSPVIAEMRLLIGCLVVLAVQAARGKLRTLRLRERGGLLIADGACLGVHWLLMFEAYKRLSVATAILIVFVGPVLVAALVGPVLNERVERRTLFSLALSLAGMVMIALPAWHVQDPLGVLFAFGSAVGFAAILLMGKRLTETYKTEEILVWQLGVGAVAIAPVALVSALHGGARGLPDALPQLVTLALVHTALAGFIYLAALKVVKAQHVGVLTYLEPATAGLYAWLFLHEKTPVWTMIGGALIMAGGLNILLGGQAARRREQLLAIASSPEEPVGSGPEIKASLGP